MHKVLVTGGMGYIGSHTAVALIKNGFETVIMDNLSNARPFILDGIAKITGVKPDFYLADACDKVAVEKLLSDHAFEAVIHFAAFKSVSESALQPLKYYRNNIDALLTVLESMAEHQVRPIIFSSSATVYGQPDVLPVTEATPFKSATTAYGHSKQAGEEILRQTALAGFVKAVALRYFNPVGADPSGLIGELPSGIPNNLFPFIVQAASGKLKQLTVYGNDYDTPDGSCIRDYIHVVDLANAHVAALKRVLGHHGNDAFEVYNIGTGRGNTVFEVITNFEKLTGVKLNYTVGPRRAGDVAEVYADTSRANTVLDWKAALGLDRMILDTWNWENNYRH